MTRLKQLKALDHKRQRFAKVMAINWIIAEQHQRIDNKPQGTKKEEFTLWNPKPPKTQ